MRNGFLIQILPFGKKGSHFPLDGHPFTVGSSLFSSENYPHLSDEHAVVMYVEEKGWVIWDCGSSDGTYLNFSEIDSYLMFDLRMNDVIGFGVQNCNDGLVMKFVNLSDESACTPRQQNSVSARELQNDSAIIQNRTSRATKRQISNQSNCSNFNKKFQPVQAHLSVAYSSTRDHECNQRYTSLTSRSNEPTMSNSEYLAQSSSKSHSQQIVKKITEPDVSNSQLLRQKSSQRKSPSKSDTLSTKSVLVKKVLVKETSEEDTAEPENSNSSLPQLSIQLPSKSEIFTPIIVDVKSLKTTSDKVFAELEVSDSLPQQTLKLKSPSELNILNPKALVTSSKRTPDCVSKVRFLSSECESRKKSSSSIKKRNDQSSLSDIIYRHSSNSKSKISGNDNDEKEVSLQNLNNLNLKFHFVNLPRSFDELDTFDITGRKEIEPKSLDEKQCSVSYACDDDSNCSLDEIQRATNFPPIKEILHPSEDDWSDDSSVDENSPGKSKILNPSYDWRWFF